MKKLFALLLATVLVFAVCVSVFATQTDEEGTNCVETTETIFSITTNTSDNENNGKPIKDCVLVGDWYSDKFATNWKDSAVWNNFMNALRQDTAKLCIVVGTGNVTKVGFQSDLANVEVPVETVDGYAVIEAETLLSACAEALADGYSWCNFIISGDAGTTVLAISVATDTLVYSETDPIDYIEDSVTPEETPVDTGLALAVVPMIVAAAAVALSKKR